MTEHDLLVFGKDGTYKSKVVIDIGAVWHVEKLAIFSSGNFLVAGEKWQKAEQNYAPFTAIFSSNGTYLKELSLEDDAKIYKYTVDGDSKGTAEAAVPTCCVSATGDRPPATYLPSFSKNRQMLSIPRWKFGMWNFSLGACRLSSGSPKPIMTLGIFSTS